MKYRKKPVIIEATQWFKNGDHPKDDCKQVGGADTGADHLQLYLSEGEVVRYYRWGNGKTFCKHCNKTKHEHGWIDTLEGGYIVCPGDFIITGVKGEHYPCKSDVFEMTYEKVKEDN